MENVIITNDDISEIFKDIVDDNAFMKQMGQGFITYIMLNMNDVSLSIANVKKSSEDDEEKSILDSDNILAVKAFEYLKEVIAH